MGMKKIFLIFCFAFTMTIPVMSIGMVINDVSPSSSLYPYVVEMIQDNIMSLDSNSNFNGSLVVTRADLARILSNLLNYFQGRIQPVSQVSQPTAQGTAISADLLLKIQQIESTIEKYPMLQSYITLQASTVSVLSSQMNQLETQITAMQNIMASLSSIQNVPSSSVLSKTIDRVSKVENSVEIANSKISSINSEMSSIGATITNIEDQISSLSGNSSFNSQLNDLKSENANLKSKISSLESTIGSVYFFQAIEALAVIGAIAYIVFVK